MADLIVTAGSVVLTSGPSDHGTAGATITAGQAVYKDAANSNVLKLAQADGTAAEAEVAGIALNGGATGQPVRYAQDSALINIGATTAKTTAYVLAAAAGGIAPQADLLSGERIVYLGYATATDGTFRLNIRNTGAVV